MKKNILITCLICLSLTSVLAQEIDITGCNMSIPDGTTAVSSNNRTNFGMQQTTSATVSRTFTILNTGSSTLTLTGSSPYIVISGTNASDFSVTSIPSSSIAAGGSTTFTITFDPSATGTRAATLTIANNDANESSYDFNIQGTGIANRQARWVNNSGGTRPSSVTVDGISYNTYSTTYLTINDALEAAVSTDVVYVCNGNYRNPKRLTSTNCSIVGVIGVSASGGQDTGLYLNVNQNNLLITSETGDYTTSSANLYGYGWDIMATSNIIIQGFDMDSIRVNGFFNSNGYGFGYSTDVKILNNRVVRTYGHGIKTDTDPLLTDRSGWIISGNKFDSIGFYKYSGCGGSFLPVSGMWLGEAGSGFDIDNNTLTDIKWAGILCDGYGNASSPGLTTGIVSITNNKISKTVDAGAQIGFSTANFYFPSNAYIGGNYFKECNTHQELGIGAITILSSNMAGVQIINNHITESYNGLAVDIAGWMNSPDTKTIKFNNFCSLVSGSYAVTHKALYGPNCNCGTPDNLNNYAFANNFWGSPCGPTYSTNPGGNGEALRKDATVISGGSFNGQPYSTNDFSYTPFATLPYTVTAAGSNVCSYTNYPEVNIKGNGTTPSSIADDDAVPSFTDSTNFGNVATGLSLTRRYTIENSGVGDLVISSGGITLGGTHASLYTIGGITLPVTITQNNSTTFTVAFAPVTFGVKTATVTIANGDCNESTYNFGIEGTGICGLSAVATGTTPVLCYGGSNGTATVSAIGGISPYTYNWSVSGGTSTTGTGLSAGTYTATITDAATCTATQTFAITQPVAALSISSSSSTNVTCYGLSNGTASVTASGGTTNYAYNWSPAGGTNRSATGLAPNNYTVTVTDAMNCTTTQTFTINQPSASLSIASSSFTDITCNGLSNGTASLTATGGTTPYSYSWSSGGSTAAIASGLITGNYTATITDAGGCTTTQTFAITQPSVVSAPTGSSSQQYASACNTVAHLSATGSNIQWYDASSGGNLLSSSIALSNTTHYYASQTVSGCESPTRLDVTANSTTTYTFSNVSGNEWTTSANWSPCYPGTTIPAGYTVTPSADMVIPSSTIIENNGTISIPSGITLTNAGTINNNSGGIVTNNNTLDNSGGTFNNSTGSIYKGTGAFSGSLFTNAGGTVAPGNSPGCQTYGGGFTNSTGSLSIEVNGTTTACSDYDQLQVTGTATLSGTLNVNIGYSPANNDQVTFITATTAVSGTFSTINAPAGWTVSYTSTTAKLTYSTAPEINVKGNSISIADGASSPTITDHTDFSTTASSRTFTIENIGIGTLTLGSNTVSISGTNAADFSVTTQPASTVSGSGSTTFIIAFNPSATGTRNATININSDDADENPYNFDIHGTGSIVNVSGSVSADGGYSTLGAAFTAINGATQTSAVIAISILGNTSESTSGATLNSGAWTSLSIKPRGGASRTVSAAVTAGLSLIKLNGTDNVTIDGLNTGGNSLTLSNTTVQSGTDSTSTIRFLNGATLNTITNCTIQGSSISASLGGTIFFSTDISTSSGNDSNTISNNNIGPAGSNLHAVAILSAGTPAKKNSGNIISGNNIFDYFNATTASVGVSILSGNTHWTIQNNKLYQTATRTQTAVSIHAGIRFGSTDINNSTISGNTIGYASSSGTGTYTFVGSGSGSRFYPIYIPTHGTTTVSNIDGNSITAISVTGPVSGTGTSSPFTGILVSANALVDIGTTTGNTIGSTSASGAIVFNSSSASSSEVMGILLNTSSSRTVNNNSIGGIAASNSSTGAVIFYGIRMISSTSSVNTIQNNTVGFSSAPIVNNVSATNSPILGIASATATSIITGNTVAYLSDNCAMTSATLDNIGISIIATSATGINNVSQNTVHSLINTNASSAGFVVGIDNNAASLGTPHNISKNNIHSLSVSGSNERAYGIYARSGNNNYINNMVRLGYSTSGSSITDVSFLYGIIDAAGTNNFYFNSIYIGGTGNTGSLRSACIRSNVTSGTRETKNNILYNARSNGSGTAPHYCVLLDGLTGLTSDYNDLYANGTGGVLGSSAATDLTSLSAWKTATGQDANSQSADPQFINPTGSSSTGDIHINSSISTPVEATGTAIGGISDDYDADTRASYTPTDMGADAGNFTAGTTEINVKGNGTTPTSIVDGDASPSATDSTDFGNVTVSSSLVRRYTIENTGNLTLTISSITSTGTNNSEFVVSGAPTTVDAGSSKTFIVTYTPTAIGIRTATITINNSDANESTYDFAVQGGSAGITIKGNGNDITDGDATPSSSDSTNFGTRVINTSLVRRYTIVNDGGSAITIYSITSTNSSEFTVTNYNTTIGAGSSGTFIVTFTPTTTGTRTGVITVSSSDATNSSYDFAVEGNGITTYTFTGTGDWTDPTKWSPSYPGLTIPSGITAVVLPGSTLTIPTSTAIVNNGIVTNNGTITETSGGTFTNTGTFKGSGTYNSSGPFINPVGGLVSPGD